MTLKNLPKSQDHNQKNKQAVCKKHTANNVLTKKGKNSHFIFLHNQYNETNNCIN